ncbi:amidohydrolase [Neobacillus kokaensis]|uniref:Peptidase M20 n=1 Tax=Neobacillus kokaensis TaxID=2759023 RepID=A0ABQ3N583_9BACI|nr:amidohydrolase [Neobacillus kokaensis]GHH99872.1 peptidase M20 [Neobacillus kokaensis]
MMNQISELTEEISQSLIEWRRDFHTYAESGWVEFRTASIVASKLSSWGYDVSVGREVVDEQSRMGVPDEAALEQHKQRALSQGGHQEWIDQMAGGFTGVVGVLNTGRPGPTIGLRFDMDALDIQESSDGSHRPLQEGFFSLNENMMHACGHDAHTAIGLGAASVLSNMKDQLNGCYKLIFQPSEEGVRGAKSMVNAGVVDDVDIFIAMHIGLGAELGEFICSDLGFLATTKFDVTFTGKAAHAGANPEEGNNALLAAATATLNMHAISSHSQGSSRINVGVFQAGSGRNIIPNKAFLKVETRGETTEVNEYMCKRAFTIIQSASDMYDVTSSIKLTGEAKTVKPSTELLSFLRNQARSVTEIHTIKGVFQSGGSEDATYMMSRVQEKGGQAAYVVFGTPLAAGHHNEKFDIDEKVMPIAVKTLINCITNINGKFHF